MSSHVLLLPLLWGAVAFAVSIDASRRGRHGGFWAAVTFFTGAFGAILYGLVVLTTSDPTDDGSSEEAVDPELVRVCPTCSSKHDDSADRCDECGAELGPGDEHPIGRKLPTGSRRYCSNCHSEVGREATVCQWCGAVF